MTRKTWSCGVAAAALLVCSDAFVTNFAPTRGTNALVSSQQFVKHSARAQTLAPCSKISTPRRSGVVMQAMGGGGGSANLNPELYTEKAWEAVTRLPALADENGAQMVETELLLKSLLNEGPQVCACL
jgi:hypothetical protein